MDRTLLSWTHREEVDGGSVVNYQNVTLLRPLLAMEAGRTFARATYDKIGNTLDLYGLEGHRPTATVKLRLVAVEDHDDLVTHAPVWRALFEEKIARLRANVFTDGDPEDDERAQANNDNDVEYWQHELRAFERRVARARAES